LPLIYNFPSYQHLGATLINLGFRVARILKVFLKEMTKLRFHYQISFEKYVSAYVDTMLLLYSTSKLALPTVTTTSGSDSLTANSYDSLLGGNK
jgi:hypothetical protein